MYFLPWTDTSQYPTFARAIRCQTNIPQIEREFSRIRLAFAVHVSKLLLLFTALLGGLISHPCYGQAPDFTISLTPLEQDETAGSSGGTRVSITSLDSFAGTVVLTFSAPNFPQSSLTPNQVSVGQFGVSYANLVVPIPATTPSGTYLILIAGTSGSLSHSATFCMIVTSQSQPCPGKSLPSNPVVPYLYGILVAAVAGTSLFLLRLHRRSARSKTPPSPARISDR
jgi:hypothetical protein